MGNLNFVFNHTGRRRKPPPEGIFSENPKIQNFKKQCERVNESSPFLFGKILSEPEFTEFSGLTGFFNSQLMSHVPFEPVLVPFPKQRSFAPIVTSRANKDKIENSKCCLNPDFQDLGICGISKFMEGRAKRLALFVLLTVAASQSMEVFV